MIGDMCNSVVLGKLRKMIKSGKYIVVFLYEDEELLECVCEALRSSDNVSILVQEKESLKRFADIEMVNFVSREDINYICSIYYLYEFSDRITVLEDRDDFPNLLNYISCGILSKEEAAQAIAINVRR